MHRVYQKVHLAFWAVVAIVLGAGAAFGLVSGAAPHLLAG